MNSVYHHIQQAKQKQRKLLALLIDPEKTSVQDVAALSEQIRQAPVTHLLVGGSTFSGHHLDELVRALKKSTSLPVVLFPGHHTQISVWADAVLFLSLTSGRNPDYLIEQHIQAVPLLQKTELEVIPTSYILIQSSLPTAVERVSQTKPLDRNNPALAAQTAMAGQFLGHQLIYLEAGSGAQDAVPAQLIQQVAQTVSIPVVVGGGIRSQEAIQAAYDAGADVVVIGTAFEQNPKFFEQIS